MPGNNLEVKLPGRVDYQETSFLITSDTYDCTLGVDARQTKMPLNH